MTLRKASLLTFADFLTEYREADYELSRLLYIAWSLPVTSAEAQRSFSCLAQACQKLLASNDVRRMIVKLVTVIDAFG